MVTAPLKTRLLVVDDDSLLRELLSFLLHDTEFHLTAFDSGEGALRFLGNHATPTHAILTDLQMPGESGAELAGAFRRIAPSALLLGMSARVPEDGEAAAFDAFVPKPFDVEVLRDALRTAARSREQASTLNEKASSPPLSTTHSTSTQSSESEPAESSDAETHTADPVLQNILDPQIYAKLKAVISPAQLHQMYEMTAGDVESRLGRMRQSLSTGDGLSFRHEAHAIKGGCAMVGAMELSRLAAQAEVSSETDSRQVNEMFQACLRLRKMITIVSP